MDDEERKDARAALNALTAQFEAASEATLAKFLRVYEPDECGADGYPFAWHAGVKHLVREQADHRCVRCGHPYRTGESPPEWSPCDGRCTHRGPLRVEVEGEYLVDVMGRDEHTAAELLATYTAPVEAQWRILTVHHLTGEKADLRWWNLAALCQRCHLQVQGRVRMEQVYPHEHSEWFKPYAAGYYAWTYLGEDLGRAEVEGRLEELLALEWDPLESTCRHASLSIL